MTRIDFLLAELTREAQTARKHLERLPAGQFDCLGVRLSSTAPFLASSVSVLSWTAVFLASQGPVLVPRPPSWRFQPPSFFRGRRLSSHAAVLGSRGRVFLPDSSSRLRRPRRTILTWAVKL